VLTGWSNLGKTPI
jgi:hypothetical protein